MAPTKHPLAFVDRVLCHLSVGGQLPAEDRHQIALRTYDLVTSREVRGLGVLRRAEQWPQPGPCADHVVLGQRFFEPVVHTVEQVANVGWCAHRCVERAVVVRVRGPDVDPVVRVVGRDDEDRPFVATNRYDSGDVGADLREGHDDVDALRRSDRERHRTREGRHLFGPHPGGVDDATGPHGTAIVEHCTREVTRRRRRERPHAAMVQPDGAVIRCGPHQCEREPSIISLGVEVEEAGRHLALGQPTHVRHRLRHAEAFVDRPDPPAAGDVIEGQRGRVRLRHGARHHALLAEQGDQERHHADDVRCVAQEPLTLPEVLVDQSVLLLLQVAQTAMHQLR